MNNGPSDVSDHEKQLRVTVMKKLAKLKVLPPDLDVKYFVAFARTFYTDTKDYNMENDFFSLVRESVRPSPALLCVILGIYIAKEERNTTAELLRANPIFRGIRERLSECTVMEILFFKAMKRFAREGSLPEEWRMSLEERALEVIFVGSISAYVRREILAYLSVWHTLTIRQRIINELITCEVMIIVDELTAFLKGTMDRFGLTESDICRVQQRFLELQRPGKPFHRLIARTLTLQIRETKEVPEFLRTDFKFRSAAPTIIGEIFELIGDKTVDDGLANVRQELYNILFQYTNSTVDVMIDHIEVLNGMEKMYVEAHERIVSAIRDPRKCSSKMLEYFLNHTLAEFGPGEDFSRYLVICKGRIQRTPAIITNVFTDINQLNSLLKLQNVQKMFQELTTGVLMSESVRPWEEVDAALTIMRILYGLIDIGRLGKDYILLFTDDNEIRGKVLPLLAQNDDYPDYVAVSAALYLMRQDPNLLRHNMDCYFKKYDHEVLRLAILNDLTSCLVTELPDLEVLKSIAETVAHLETDKNVRKAGIAFVTKMHQTRPDFDVTPYYASLMTPVALPRLAYDIDALVSLLDSVSLPGNCFIDHVSKECY